MEGERAVSERQEGDMDGYCMVGAVGAKLNDYRVLPFTTETAEVRKQKLVTVEVVALTIVTTSF